LDGMGWDVVHGITPHSVVMLTQWQHRRHAKPSQATSLFERSTRDSFIFIFYFLRLT
jgi:hypothetical protein